MFPKRNPFISFIIFSLSIHLFVLGIFLFAYPSDSERIILHLTKGSPISLQSISQRPNSGIGQVSMNQNAMDQLVGTNTDEAEIERFRNSLTYPEIALEQALEDECTFRVTVAENGGVENLTVIAPCRYDVFDAQIRTQLRFWKFLSSKGKNLILPIRFRIHVRE
ncbi:MAG: TonB family protein [Leptospira sp.]|nr:TonB family protein [Leptospira sp.]